MLVPRAIHSSILQFHTECSAFILEPHYIPVFVWGPSYDIPTAIQNTVIDIPFHSYTSLSMRHCATGLPFHYCMMTRTFISVYCDMFSIAIRVGPLTCFVHVVWIIRLLPTFPASSSSSWVLWYQSLCSEWHTNGSSLNPKLACIQWWRAHCICKDYRIS